MIKDLNQDGVLYGARWLQDAGRSARAPRAVQSAGAEAVLAALRAQNGGNEGVSSKAHARGLVAAAFSRGDRVGIDVEYRAPGRPILAIAQFLMGSPARDEDAAYRAFTFREAYFKAWGDWPSRDLLRVVADADAPLYRAAPGLNVLHEPVAPDFLLTLVWEGDRAAVRAI